MKYIEKTAPVSLENRGQCHVVRFVDEDDGEDTVLLAACSATVLLGTLEVVALKGTGWLSSLEGSCVGCGRGVSLPSKRFGLLKSDL